MLRLTLRKDPEDGPSTELVLDRTGPDARFTVVVDGQTSCRLLRDREFTPLSEALHGARAMVFPQSRSLGIGDRLSLTVELDGTEAHFGWAGSVPAGWEDLSPIISEMLALGRAATGLYSVR